MEQLKANHNSEHRFRKNLKKTNNQHIKEPKRTWDRAAWIRSKEIVLHYPSWMRRLDFDTICTITSVHYINCSLFATANRNCTVKWQAALKWIQSHPIKSNVALHPSLLDDSHFLRFFSCAKLFHYSTLHVVFRRATGKSMRPGAMHRN